MQQAELCISRDPFGAGGQHEAKAVLRKGSTSSY